MINMRGLDFTKFAPELTPESDWGRCMRDFINHIYSKSNSPHSQDHYRATLEQFLSLSPRKLPHEYTRADVLAWIGSPGTANGREGQPGSAGLWNNRLIVLSGLYRFAQSYGIPGEDGHLYPLMRYLPPTAGIHHPKRADGGQKALSDEELRKFFSAIPRDTLVGKRDFALFSLYLWSARRRSEIGSLQWRDLSQSLIVDGHTTRTAWVYRFFGKGHKSVADFAELPPVAATALFEYLEASEIIKTIQPDDYLFTCVPGYIGRRGYDPKRPITSTTIQGAVDRYRRAAGIERHFGVHALRHTSARTRFANGATLLEIKNLLRHRAISTTSIYLDELVTPADPTSALLNAKFGNL